MIKALSLFLQSERCFVAGNLFVFLGEVRDVWKVQIESLMMIAEKFLLKSHFEKKVVLCVWVGTRKCNLLLAKIKKKNQPMKNKEELYVFIDLSGLQFQGNKIQDTLKMCFWFYKTISMLIPQTVRGWLLIMSLVCQERGFLPQRSSYPVEKGLA